jgi:hypothetical protein
VDDVNVIFARYTSTEKIESSLKAVPARIISGPDYTGVYIVRLENVNNEKERKAAIIKLRNEPHVIFAEAAQPLSVPKQGGRNHRDALAETDHRDAFVVLRSAGTTGVDGGRAFAHRDPQ